MLGTLRRRGVIFLCALALAGCTAAHASAQPAAARVYTMSSGRLWAAVGMLVGLTGLVIGARALARSRDRSLANARLGPVVAVVAGLIGSALGATVVTTSVAGVGTGNGRGGAVLAIVIGLIAMVLGARALARSRHTG